MTGRDESPGEGDLVAAVHAQLRRLARQQLDKERKDHTLQPTALVHEAWLCLRDRVPLDEPARFYAAAAEAMRLLLIDHARRRGAKKRAGNLRRLPLDVVEVAREASLEEVMAVDEAIAALAATSPRAAEVVRLRFFAGLEEAEVAEVLGTSERTVRREWAFARAVLWRKLRDGDGPPA